MIEGNIQMHGGIDCGQGEQVVSVKHSDNGAVLSRYLLIFSTDRRSAEVFIYLTTACLFLVAGLFSGVIKVYNSMNGTLLASLENEDIAACDYAPISRIRIKPPIDLGGQQHQQQQTLLAATYVSGHLRIWNYASGQCVGQVGQEDSTAYLRKTGHLKPISS